MLRLVLLGIASPASYVQQHLTSPEKLAEMAANAHSTGRPDAARLLAAMVEAIASGSTIAQFKETRS